MRVNSGSGAASATPMPCQRAWSATKRVWRS